MSGNSPTRLIERATLRVLLETSRAGTQLAHTVSRKHGAALARERPPSALRGLLILVVLALAVRALVRWIW